MLKEAHKLLNSLKDISPKGSQVSISLSSNPEGLQINIDVPTKYGTGALYRVIPWTEIYDKSNTEYLLDSVKYDISRAFIKE